MGDVFYIVLLVGVVVAVLIAVAVSGKNQKAYMEAQRANNTDKQGMLELMEQAMGEQYSQYSYIVGYYTKIKQHLNTTTYYYFPYILAFSESELFIFSFIKENGKLYLRNRLPINWSITKFSYKFKKNTMVLTFKILGDTMPINIDPVIKSGGVEKSDRPICVYQEQEYRRLAELLERYRSYGKG